eukprot:486565_1
MSDRLEERKDFTESAKEKIPKAKELAEDGRLKEGLELLMGLERNCRVGNDYDNLKEVLLVMCRLCKDCGNWELLNATASSLARRQHSKAISAMVKECTEWIDATPSKAVKEALVVTLRDITEGKIFVEAERAALSRILAGMKEEEGDIDKAQEVMQDVAVETYGALDKREKTDFILEQIRLTLAKKDFVRASITSRKLSRKALEAEDMQDMKVRFYDLMIEYHMQKEDAFELSKCYYAIFDTASIREDPSKWKSALFAAGVLLILSPYSNEQNDMLVRMAALPEISKEDGMESFNKLMKLFTSPEIIAWPLMDDVMQLVEFLPHPASALKDKKWLADLRTRTVQHNIRVIAKYYTRVRLAHFAELLLLEASGAEKVLSGMVSDGYLYARIDRSAGIVSFRRSASTVEVLSAWNSDLAKLVSLVESTTHLVRKETASLNCA